MQTNKKGFTLMELLVVVIIIAGFAALAYPSYVSNVERARASEAVHMLATIQAAQQKNYVNYEEYAYKFQDLNDFEPSIANFEPNSNTFSSEYFKYSLSSHNNCSAQRINKAGQVSSKGYTLSANYNEDFVRCNVDNNSENGEKVCSSLTDKEKVGNYYPIY